MDGLKTIEQFIDRDSELICPSCGHFAGVYEICPRCGADVVKRTSLKVIKYCALFLATVGLFFLYLWSKNREFPLLHVRDITAPMNFARVRMEGIVVRKAKVNTEFGKVTSLTFRMCDGEIGNHEDTILVIAYRDIAAKLVKQGRLPSQWDKVKIQGQVQVKKGEGILLIQAPEQLIIEAAPAIPLKSVTDGMVKIRVRVEKVQRPDKGSTKPTKITVSDGMDTRQLVVWANVYQAISDVLQVGQIVEANVKAGKYREQLQLELRSAQDFHVIGPKNFTVADRVLKAKRQLPNNPISKIAVTKILSPGDINSHFLGKRVTVQGSIARQYPFSKGLKWVIGEKGMTINAVLWPPLGVSGVKFSIGDIVEISGLVKQFKGKFELHPQSERDIVLQKAKIPKPNLSPKNPIPEEQPDNPAPQPHKLNSVLKPSQVDKSLLGKRVTVEGNLVREYTFSKGAKWLIADNKGSIQALLWQKLRDKAAQKIAIGDKVRITGKVKQYKDRLELQPKGIDDIVLVEKKDYQRIADLQVDRQAKVQGKVSGRQLLPHGVKLKLEDRSGAIDVILTSDSFRRSLLFYTLKADYRLKVKGQVVRYQDKLQLQPASENDIEILAQPPKHPKKTVPEKKQLTVIKAKSVACQMIPPGVKLVISEVQGMPAECHIIPGKRIDVILRSPSFADLDYLKSLGRGSAVEITGQIGKYRGQYQLQITTHSDVKLLQLAQRNFQKQPKRSKRPKKGQRQVVCEEREYYPLIHDWQKLNARALNAPLWVYGILSVNGENWSLKLGEHSIALRLGSLNPAGLKAGKVKIKGIIIEENEKRVLAAFAIKFL